MPPIGLPLAHPKFTLDSSAVAGFFGGDEAISAMATVHLYEGRRWLGWFNSPGSYTVAKRFGRMANSRFWDGLFPGPNDSPAVSFGLDDKKGPEYIAALSGTTMYTGHLAFLTMARSKELEVIKMGGRVTRPCDVTYLAMKHFDYDTPAKRLSLNGALLGFFPITVSVVTCVICALVYDWFCFSMILLGIISGGLASFVIGKGRLVIRSVNNPAKGSPPGHGILKGEKDVVVLKGKERDVNVITKGRFDIETDPEDKEQGGDKEKGDEENGTARSYDDIGVCSLLLLVQFLVQLLLIPQGTLFGQIMFLISLVASWGYNSYLSSLEKEKIQTDILFRTLGNPVMYRFRAGTRTMMAVFVCLLLFHGVDKISPKEKERKLRKILNSCLPNDTTVWSLWTDIVVKQLLDTPSGLQHEQDLDSAKQNVRQNLALPEKDLMFSEDDKKLLNNLLDDSVSAIEKYLDVRGTLPVDSSQQTSDGH